MKRTRLNTGIAAFVLLALMTMKPADALTVRTGSFSATVPDSAYRSFFSVSTRLFPKSLHRSEIENIYPCNDTLSCDFFLSWRSRETARVVSVKKTDEETIKKYVDSLSSSVDHPARNAVFGETPEKTVVLIAKAEGGQVLDKEKAVLTIRDSVESGSSIAELPVVAAEPEDASDPAALGISELIAEGTTNFRGSPKNRIFNINRALEQFQGILIGPGEEFSFVKQLGEVDGERGYLPELVIKNNKTEPEFGGGICQVSSTMFRTAVNAGMRITARRNHAYPVSYYKPYGMDATIYIPNPDLRFVNNTPGHILILSSVEGTSLTFRFYGTNDGRKVEIDGPTILESNPDGSMKTTFSQKVTDVSGSVIIDDKFPSNYKSPSLFPHPQDFTVKPAEWSKKQWEEYLAAKAVVTTPKPTAPGN
ncbi:MAG: hypothetical protein HGA31_06225 [Candidatus Moranbacteria bacterium]|nr:hypothetical protein [Candidatus Moranbacteria bacterium]